MVYLYVFSKTQSHICPRRPHLDGGLPVLVCVAHAHKYAARSGSKGSNCEQQSPGEAVTSVQRKREMHLLILRTEVLVFTVIMIK